MKYIVRTIAALTLAGGCIRERAPATPDADVTEALRPSPGREIARVGDKPDVPVPTAAPAPPEPTIEERLRRCDPAAAGAVVRLPDDVAYTAEATATATVVRLVRRAGGEFLCERYEATAGSPRVAWPGAPAPGRVVLATAVGAAVAAGSAALVELGEGPAVRGVALLQGACAPGSTVQAVRVFAGAPSLQVRCWIATAGFWTAVDHIVHRGPRGWEVLTSSESGRVVRSPTMVAPPANPSLPGSIRVAETGASPRLEVATSSVDVRSGATKFARQSLRWNAAAGLFGLEGTSVVERGSR